MSLSKDITHAAFFITWLLMFMRLVDTRLEKIKHPSFFLGFLILGLCSSLSKKIGKKQKNMAHIFNGTRPTPRSFK